MSDSNHRVDRTLNAEYLQRVLNSTVHGIMAFQSVRDATGKIVDFTWTMANHQAEVLLGRTQDQLLGQSVWQASKTMTPDLFAQYVAVVETNRPLQYEHRHQRQHDGSVVWFDITITRLDDGFTAFFTDITRQKSMQDEFDMQQARLSAIVESSNNSIVGTTTGGIVTSWNPSAELLYGYTADEMIGQPIARIIPPEIKEETLQHIRKTAQGERVEIHETTRVRKDGQRILIWLVLSPVKNRHGEIIGISAISHDISQFKAALLQLEQVESRNHAIIASMIEGVVLQSASGEIELCNAAAERILGLTHAQMAGRTSVDPRWRAIHEDGTPFPGEDHPAMVVLRTGEPQSNVVMGVHKPDGELTWILINAQPLKTAEDDRPYAVVATFVDITDRKRVQDNLRQSEERFRLVLNTSSIIVAQVDLDLRYVWIHNPHPDFDHMAVIGKRDDELEDNAGTRALMALKQQVIATGESAEIEIAFPLSDGEITYDVLATPVFDEHHNLTGATTVAFDITERKRMEDALRVSETRHRMMIQGTRAGTWEWNVQTGETVFNERWAEIIGYKLAELEPVTIETWVSHAHPDDLEYSNQLLQAHFAGKTESYECEVRMKHRDGHWVWVSDRGKVMEWTADGQPLRMYGTHIDITNRKLAEERALALQIEKERGDLLAQFIEQSSHEFKTPITIIQTNAYLLGKIDDREKRQEKVQTIDRQVARVNKLVETLQKMSQLDRLPELDYSLTKINQIVKDTVFHFKRMSNHPIHENYDAGLPVIMADTDYLHEALSQLLDNAIQYTPEGLPIYVSTGCEDDFVLIQVRDTGVGIPEDVMPRIFERLYRQDSAHTTPGFGLGLPIALSIVEKHGGTIDVESVINEGSTFTIKLPIKHD